MLSQQQQLNSYQQALYAWAASAQQPAYQLMHNALSSMHPGMPASTPLADFEAPPSLSPKGVLCLMISYTVEAIA